MPIIILQDKLSLADADICWGQLAGQLTEALPEAFEAYIWPALAEAGWERQLQVPGAPAGHVYTPPQQVASAYKAQAGHAAGPCSSAADVLAVLHGAAQPVPGVVVRRLREHAFELRLGGCLAASGSPAAPHRRPGKPDARSTTPNCQRNIMCGNCGVSACSVWRPGNAGVQLCNACGERQACGRYLDAQPSWSPASFVGRAINAALLGHNCWCCAGMFFKHHGVHRPEHLLAAARAKWGPAAAAGCAGLPVPRPGSECGTPRRPAVAHGPVLCLAAAPQAGLLSHNCKSCQGPSHSEVAACCTAHMFLPAEGRTTPTSTRGGPGPEVFLGLLAGGIDNTELHGSEPGDEDAGSGGRGSRTRRRQVCLPSQLLHSMRPALFTRPH
jgi:hypothetical protein